jgi:hypothetical protein
MAYDVARERLVLFGSRDRPSGASDDFLLPRTDTWLGGSLVPATAQTIGSPCTGTNGPPVITSGTPFVGNPAFALDLLSARSLAPCFFALAANTQALQLGGGCTLYVRDVFLPLVTTANASGVASVQLPIPRDVALRGAIGYAQAFVLDPMGPFAGHALSAGLRHVLGD